jgi:hypothetical protein
MDGREGRFALAEEHRMSNLGKQLAPEFAIACVMLLGGLLVAERGWSYSIGSIRSIGPGFFPFWLGLLLAMLSGIRIVQILTRSDGAVDEPEGGEPADPFPWRPMVVIPAAIAAWVFLLKPLGLVPATIILVAITTLAEWPIRPRSALVSAVVIPAACYFLFIYVLQMPLAAIAW